MDELLHYNLLVDYTNMVFTTTDETTGIASTSCMAAILGFKLLINASMIVYNRVKVNENYD